MNISLAAEPIFHIGAFPVTNTLLVAWAIMLFLFLVAFLVRRNLREVPGRLQNIAEAVIDALLGFIESITLDRRQAIKFFPLVATIFIFVLFSNLVEIVPGLGTIGLKELHEGKEIIVPFIRSSSADLNVTLAIASITMIAVQVFGISALGLARYAHKFFNFKNPIEFFVGILELISEFAKIVSFSFRLFGNIFAGEVLLTVVLFLVPYFVPLPFLFLEIFVGLVQALVFSMLALVFLKMAGEAHGGHEEAKVH
ncbi:F0F1 ATP synthase subunit A [Candidatus Uhrbacteria bacterium]|nr:F0F1 ATP synthase subunit A [Candidatus Uhrbacteria bacterium]